MILQGNLPIPQNIQYPDGWGKDELTKFQANAQNNEFATFQNSKQAYSLLIELDKCLLSVSELSIIHSHKNELTVGFLLFINAHNHFRATVRLLAAGQCLSVYPVGRAALESALYGWLLVTEPEADEKWHNRPDRRQREENQAWSRYFQVSTIATKISLNNEGLSGFVKHLHQLSIEFGAHPNTTALYSNISVSKMADGGSLTEHIFLHKWGTASAHSLKFSIETGISILDLASMCEPEFDRLMQINEAIDKFKDAYHALMPLLEAEIIKATTP